MILPKIELTDDPLKNICIMAPLLDEAGQNRVLGMICGILGFSGKDEKKEEKEAREKSGESK